VPLPGLLEKLPSLAKESGAAVFQEVKMSFSKSLSIKMKVLLSLIKN
jgi:hypothetical protein